MTQTEALKHLKATTEAFGPDAGIELDQKAWSKLHTAIKETLAQQSNEQVEPRAYLVYAKGSHRYFTLTFDIEKVPEIYKGGDVEPLYTHPPVPTAQPKETEQKPVAWRAWFDADNSAKWLFTLWPEEEHPSFDWQPLYTHPPVPYVTESRTAQPKETEQEPVAWRWIPSDVWGSYVLSDSSERAKLADEHGLNPQPLYTTPPQRTWVKLTDEDRAQCIQATAKRGSTYELISAIEAKLKEKNERLA